MNFNPSRFGLDIKQVFQVRTVLRQCNSEMNSIKALMWPPRLPTMM
jgi:hypothetical protein